MRHLTLACFLACVLSLSSAYLPQGIDYSKYDPQKLQQRYDIIQALVRPKAAYRPKIGSAYSQRGYNNKGRNYGGYTQPAKRVYAPVAKATIYAPAAQKPVYNPYAPVRNTGYAPVKNTGYAPVRNTAYATGYANPAPRAPVNYGYQGYGGIRFGGGKVHPIFNNDNLYKSRGLGPYDTTDPIFIGGAGPTKSTPNVALRSAPYGAQQPAYNAYKTRLPSPQIDAYGNSPTVTNYNPYYG